MIRSKHHKLFFLLILTFLTLSISINPYMVDADPDEYKLIRTIDIDTTGDKVSERIEILADEENQGYLVRILQKNKAYTLKPEKKFKYLAPYATFYNLNTIVADINSDQIPEIVTWGDSTHETPIHIFRWDGIDYKAVFSGFYQGFRFEDITGDKILEFVIENRLYGTGYESIYYQWRKDKYSKIFYELDAYRGFCVIKEFLESLPVEKQYVYSEEFLDNYFTGEWINNKNNLEELKKIKKDLLSIQITGLIDNKYIWKDGVSGKEAWEFDVVTYRLAGTGIVTEELTMIVDMKFIGNTDSNGCDKWRIEAIRFISAH